MGRTTLQIPLDSNLRKDAEQAALEQGFSSLQEAVRVFLKKLAKRTIGFRVEEGIQLSDKAIKKYDKMTEDIDSGRIETINFTTVDEMMTYLNS